jgi:hypothetical protein
MMASGKNGTSRCLRLHLLQDKDLKFNMSTLFAVFRWNYVQEFVFRCSSAENLFSSQSCVEDAMTHAGVEIDKIETCLLESGGFDKDVKNPLLQVEVDAAYASGVVLTPFVSVNKAPIVGSLSFGTVLKAICAGYASGSEPTVCTQCAGCIDARQCVADGSCSTGYSTLGNDASVKNQGAISFSTFTASLVSISLLFLLAAFLHHRRQQNLMHDQIRGILAEYMPIDKRASDTSVGLPDTLGDIDAPSFA